MRVPLSWLRDYVAIPANPSSLVERLTLAGLEAAGVEVYGLPVPAGLHVKSENAGLVWERDRVVVGKVTKIEKHPDADKLKLVTLEYGAGEPKTVVTGAPNIAPGESGMKVVLGLRGTRYFYTDKEGKKTVFTLEPKALRGIMNDAMCMSNFELGISDEHEGIIILDDSDPAPGTPAQDLLGEIVVELDVLPNMARCLSMIGIAREVSALTGAKADIPEPKVATVKDSALDRVKVEIADPKLCGRYTASIIRNVKVGPAPRWMQTRLHYAGMRPINNVVDITNYVMLEYGQPLHAFDYDVLVKRAGGKPPTVIVRPAKAGEKLKTLDGQVRELSPDNLIIADTAGPIALAGVMGGLETEVTDATTTILLESASFDFVSVRKTARQFTLFSEASTRFSKGVHPEIVAKAATRALQLFHEHAGGEVLAGIVDNYPAPVPPQVIDLSAAEIRRVLGFDIPAAEVVRVLTALQFQVEPDASVPAEGEAAEEAAWVVTTPQTRLDIQAGAADLIEELARVYGYDKLPESHLAHELPEQRGNRPLELEEKVRDLLADQGLQECITYSLTSVETEGKLDPKAGEKLPHEPRALAVILCGRRTPPSWDEPQDEKPPQYDFFDMKGVIENLAADLHLPKVSFHPFPNAIHLHPGRAAVLEVNGKSVGSFGELHPKVAANFNLGDRAVQVAEFDLEAILATVPERFPYRPFATFPPAKRDIAVIVPADTPAEKVLAELRAAGGDLLSDAVLFDVYQGESIPAGTKSLAFALTYQSAEKTLSDKEIDKAHQKIEGRLRHVLKAQIRGKD
jgi:phenylalanyl-tRNA synthetase beta chain